MKRILFAAASILPALAFGQAAIQKSPFTISGKIGQLNAPAKAYIDFMDNGTTVEDSATLVNGEFKFAGQSAGYSYARLALNHDGVGGKSKAVYAGDVIYFYFGKEKITITSKDSLATAVFTGSKVYNDYQAYNKQIGGTIMDLTKAANAAFSALTPEQQKDTVYVNKVNTMFRNSINARNEKQVLFAKANPNSYFGMVALSEGAGGNVDVPRIEPIFKAMAPWLKEMDFGKEVGQRIEAAKTIKLGAKAPGFTQQDVNGKPVSLASLKGKTVLVEFWASWCGPCRAENPNLREQYAVYKDKGFEIIGVSLDDKKDKWQEAIAKDGLPWIHVSDLKGWNNEVGRLYGVRAVPANYLLDKDGNIMAISLRGEELNKKLATIFAN
ncbi:peroxiredoxin [Chitinophaga skermanii]|uniref:Peroxiredoxin n=1 Tax=Chitinophaga skermanii TaxID=331697 RepID=A0A327R4V3_9BACT|nr:TlpA disulfide reductase family protein [Chitinophaga skermanii]RAJ11108.1 peroxiredoxin [Chitinophaga skermanii]